MTITRTDIEKLLHSSRQGRGLWIGMFPVLTTELMKHPCSQYLPNDAHVTLAHLGKQVEDITVERVVHALNDMGPLCLDGEITGWGVFYRWQKSIPVMLVNSAPMFTQRARLLLALSNQSIKFDERFGFIPHVTLKCERISTEDTEMFRELTDAKSVKLKWNLGVVCGDDKVMVQ